jgi:YHS domain-containing protein
MIKVASILVAGLVLLGGCWGERRFGAYSPSNHMWATAHGIKAEDRVSGRLIDPETAIKLEYQGDIYYFENEFDAEMFVRDPGVYDYRGYHPYYAGGP